MKLRTIALRTIALRTIALRTPALRTPALTATALTAGVVLALASPLTASAHVSVTPDSTAAGAYTVLTFSNAHGCEGSPTTGITIDIPEGIGSVAPTINPGWTAAKIMDSDRISQVTYTAETPLEDGFRTTFALSLQLPADAEGETLEFAVLQSCEVGEINWNQTTVDGEAEPELPAPFLVVSESAGDGHDHSSSDDHASDDHASDETGTDETGTDETGTDETGTDETGTDETGADESVVAETALSSSSDDTLARVLGVGGLVVGAIGIVLAVTARRKQVS